MVDGHEGCVLAIIGSRGVLYYQSESIIKAAILEHRPKMIVSGGARGVDASAEMVAVELGIPMLEFASSHKTWDVEIAGEPIEEGTNSGMRITVPGGYKQRNEKIAETADCVVRIASAATKTYGSGWTADHAERLGKRVYRHTV